MPEGRLERTRKNYMQSCEFCALPQECDCKCWTCTKSREQFAANRPAFVDAIQERFESAMK